MLKLEDLRKHLDTFGRVMLGYSGGVDSALLAVVATDHLGPEKFLAVTGRSPSYPESQYDRARLLASMFQIPVVEVRTDEMDDPRYAANPTNRCYYCKTELWSVLTRLATERRFDTIIDGTNVDDLGEHRPGLTAAAELGVRSPLAELGWSKDMIREAARQVGIPAWNAPAAPCLSSRIQYGLGVTPERLRQVELAEEFLRQLGVPGDLRVRHHGDHVRIEASEEGQTIVRGEYPRVELYFRELGITRFDIDPRGYRRGSMLTVLVSS